MNLRRLTSIRGQLVLLYLGILTVLLLGLGVFQSLTLRSYLRSSAAASVRRSAYSELNVLGPCYIRSPGDLETNALQLAQLLGTVNTAVTIVTPSGIALASHGMGPPGASHPLRLSATTINQLIATAAPESSDAPVPVTKCPSGKVVTVPRARHTPPPDWGGSLVNGGKTLLVAVPLGPPLAPFGYAILGRSLAQENGIASRLLIVFVLGALSALLLAALLALPLINRALRPLRRVADTAGAIAAGDFSQRANLTRSHDEVGRLGMAFDAMVDRLQSAIAATSASEERMRQFLADASHELRTPVTVLRGTSQVLLNQTGDENPEYRAALEGMHEESVRLAKLVDDLLTLSRLDEGQRLAPERIEVRSYLEEFLDRYAHLWEERPICAEVEELDGAAAWVDREALRRILTNLIDNAARYSRPGMPITLGGGAEPATVSLTVKDAGPGLTPEQAKHVFERFYRANQARSRNSGGSGLGLAIVQGLTQESGGTIEFNTAPETGTTVTVVLKRPPTE
jgi:two-component system, OmpR family, sensor kinase